MNLLIDIGNSRLKWAVEQSGCVGEIEAADYRRPEFLNELRQRWQALAAPEKMAIASVSAQAVLNAVIDLSRMLWPGVETLIPQSSGHAFGVTNAYEFPEKLGVDRWLALIGAHRHYAGAICVADCGTAITFDVLEADGTHRGGLIAPGLVMMKKALAAETAELDFASLNPQTRLATKTDAAIANGVLLAAAGLIDNAMRRFAKDHRLILTGGDAEAIAGSLVMPTSLDRALVLKGLAAFCCGEKGG